MGCGGAIQCTLNHPKSSGRWGGGGGGVEVLYNLEVGGGGTIQCTLNHPESNGGWGVGSGGTIQFT